MVSLRFMLNPSRTAKQGAQLDFCLYPKARQRVNSWEAVPTERECQLQKAGTSM